MTKIKPHRANPLRYSAWIPSIAVISVAVLTAVLWKFGPAPHKESVPKNLWPEQAANAIQEPTDKLILLAWWLIPIVIVVVGLIAWRSTRGTTSAARKVPIVFQVVLAIAAALIALAASLSRTDVWGYWRGISLVYIAGGCVSVLIIFASWRLNERWTPWLSAGTLVVVSAFLIPAMLETAEHLRDPYDFAFTGDEMAAVAAGKFPLAGYASQYSNLLGFPIAPILRLFAAHASSITVMWLVALQVVAICGAIAIPLMVSGRRMFVGALLLVVAPLMISGNGTTQTPLSYFANIPLRVVLPTLLFCLALYLIPRVSASSRWVRLVVPIGVMGGITALNNSDFGLPALAIVSAAILLSIRTLRRAAKAFVVYLLSAATVPCIYFLLLQISGNHPDLNDYLLYPRTFAVDGFFQAPMDPFGLHIAAVALFVSASATGAWLLLRGARSGAGFCKREGLALLLCGGWALLSMAYFAGRSFVPTFIGGTAFQIGLVAAAYLPLMRGTFRRSRAISGWAAVGPRTTVALSLLLIVIVASLFGLARKPLDALVDFVDSGPGTSEAINGVAIATLPGTVIDSRVAQMLPSASLLALESDLPSALAFNSPEVFTISPAFTTRQCAILKRSEFSSILIDEIYANYLSRDKECEGVLNFRDARSYKSGERTVQVISLLKG